MPKTTDQTKKYSAPEIYSVGLIAGESFLNPTSGTNSEAGYYIQKFWEEDEF